MSEDHTFEWGYEIVPDAWPEDLPERLRRSPTWYRVDGEYVSREEYDTRWASTVLGHPVSTPGQDVE